MPDNRSEPVTIRLLVVDDDTELCELVSQYLRPEGFDVEAAHDGEAGVERAMSGTHELVVLDVMLPGLNGFEVLRRIRARSSVPVLMLTARGEPVDRIVGLEIGADDYMPKPFDPRELLARVRAILRRSADRNGATVADGAVLVVGDVELDSAARTVRRDGQRVELTGVEFNLLEALLRGAGRLIERAELSRTVLGRRLQPFDRSIDMHVSNLRKKLGHLCGGQERIKTIRGLGYIYTRPEGTEEEDSGRAAE